MTPFVTVRDKKATYVFEDLGNRLDFNISSCGYVTVYQGPSCVYKNSLDEIDKMVIGTSKRKITLKLKSKTGSEPDAEDK
jgi:hypothetical protein